jgi:hypothetical protein
MSSQKNSLQLSNATNQIVLGGAPMNSGNVTTISATAPATSLTYTIPDVGQSCNLQTAIRPVIIPALTQALNPIQSGALVNASCGPTGAYISLSAVGSSQGANFQVVMATGSAGSNVTVHGPTGTLYGNVLCGGVQNIACQAKSNLNFVSGVALAGDVANFTCNGSAWCVDARAGATGGITIA